MSRDWLNQGQPLPAAKLSAFAFCPFWSSKRKQGTAFGPKAPLEKGKAARRKVGKTLAEFAQE
jgi:hypothetical protein